MNVEDLMQRYNVYILLGCCLCVLILLIIIIVQNIRIGKLNKRYQRFIAGSDAKSLEEIILTRFAEIDGLKENVDSITQKVSEMNEALLTTYQKMGIVKYDAFKEMGGKLSFVLALLNDKNSGVIINSMHSSREGCYTYAKEIIHGESFVVLSEEEKEALNLALNQKNYME